MKFDKEYLKTLFNTHSLQKFLELVNEEDIEDNDVRAIVSTLKRSIHSLDIELNPITLSDLQNKQQDSNPPHP